MTMVPILSSERNKRQTGTFRVGRQASKVQGPSFETYGGYLS